MRSHVLSLAETFNVIEERRCVAAKSYIETGKETLDFQRLLNEDEQRRLSDQRSLNWLSRPFALLYTLNILFFSKG